jgi:hypothetical protein
MINPDAVHLLGAVMEWKKAKGYDML